MKFNAKTSLALIGIIILVLIGSSYYLYAPFTRLIDEVLFYKALPGELKEIILVRGTAEGSSHWRYARPYQLTPAEITTGSWASGVNLSPDGTRKIYAEQLFAGKPVRKTAWTSVDPATWNIHIVTGEGTPEMFARGYAPQFITDTHIMYFAKSGIVIYDTSTKTPVLLTPFSTSTPWFGGQVYYSPDRQLVLWETTQPDQFVLAQVGVVEYTPLHVFTGLTSPVLTNDAVYTLKSGADGTVVLKHSFTGTVEAVATVPDSLSINALLP